MHALRFAAALSFLVILPAGGILGPMLHQFHHAEESETLQAQAALHEHPEGLGISQACELVPQIQPLCAICLNISQWDTAHAVAVADRPIEPSLTRAIPNPLEYSPFFLFDHVDRGPPLGA